MHYRFALTAGIVGLLVFSALSEEVGALEENTGVSPAASAAPNHYLDLGAGLGLDYGGVLGINLAYIPIPYISVFFATGWELIDIGWNMGIKINAIPQDAKHVFRVNFKAMYGVNGATAVVGASEYNKVFVGLTPGIGFEFMFGSQKKNGFDIDLNFPIHGSDFDDQVKRIKADPRVTSFTDPLAVAFSIGYHHEF